MYTLKRTVRNATRMAPLGTFLSFAGMILKDQRMSTFGQERSLASRGFSESMEDIVDVQVEINGQIDEAEIIELYRANGWSSADNPDQLIPALRNSHTLVTARVAGVLVGIGNAISDGYLVVYYPHMLVHPDNHGQGIVRKSAIVLKSGVNRPNSHINSTFHKLKYQYMDEQIDFGRCDWADITDAGIVYFSIDGLIKKKLPYQPNAEIIADLSESTFEAIKPADDACGW